MRNINTTSPQKYILDHLFWLIATMLCYRNVFFAVVPGTTVNQSKIILWGAVLLLAVFGCVITIKKRRNDFSLFINILLPYELYAAVTYRAYLPKLVWGSVLLGIVVSLAFIVLGLCSTTRADRQDAEQWKRQVNHSLLGARTIAAICMLVMIVPIGIRMILGLGLMHTNTPSVTTASEAAEWTVKNNIDTVRLLQEEEWTALSAQQKLDVLGVILNIEIRYLGLDHELYLKSSVLDGNTTAYYTNNDHSIVIDIDHLQTSAAADVLASLCHECYHSYQYQMIALYESVPKKYQNMLLFHPVDSYIEEFTDYIDGNEDIWGYYFQTTEVHARRYAEASVEEYYDLIDEFLQTGS